MNGNVKLILDNHVVWHEFCQSSVDKQNVVKARQKTTEEVCFSFEIIKSDQYKMFQYLDELNHERG